MQDVIGIVCARANSKRLPNKNILGWKDTTLTLNAVKTLEDAVNIVFLVTDMDIAYHNILKRPKYVSMDDTPLQTTVRWALGQINIECDIVAILMPTNPLITPEDITCAINRLKSDNLNIVRSYGMDGIENGLIVAKHEYLITHDLDTYCGAVDCHGIEIHSIEDYNFIRSHYAI